MSEEQNDIVHVEILGRPYPIRRGQLDRDRVTQIASQVDQIMQAALDRPGNLDKEAVAVLAAINIAAELMVLRDDHDTNDTSARKKSVQIETTLTEIETTLDEAIAKNTKVV